MKTAIRIRRRRIGLKRIYVRMPLRILQLIAQRIKEENLGISINQYVVNVLKKAVGMS